jgi:DNA-binding PadR family transcriptional regulator
MTRAQSRIAGYLPLREPTFFILLSLASGAKHGYAILQDVREISQGKVTLSTSTLYEALARLLDQGLIERVPDGGTGPDETGRGGDRPGRPRKAYRLTRDGRRLLEAEMERMFSLAATAQRRLNERGVESARP